MTAVDDYIKRISTTLAGGDTSATNLLSKEIVSAFHATIPNISHYRGSNPTGLHTADNLKQLRGMLIVLRDQEDNKLYGSYGLSTVTDAIRELETSMIDEWPSDAVEALYDKLDNTFANSVEAYTVGLCGYYSDMNPCDAQTELRISKLKEYRDQEVRKQRVAEAQSTSVSMNQEMSNNIAVELNILQVTERVDALSPEVLDDEEKNILQGMLASLAQSVKSDKGEAESKLQKLLKWLADKGVDVAIAVLPYIAQVIQA